MAMLTPNRSGPNLTLTITLGLHHLNRAKPRQTVHLGRTAEEDEVAQFGLHGRDIVKHRKAGLVNHARICRRHVWEATAHERLGVSMT